MDFIVQGRSASTTTSRGELKSTASGAEIRLDGATLYQVAPADWSAYCSAMQASTPPPPLPASHWVVSAHDSSYLRDGERLQVLHSLIHLAETVPATALFAGTAFGPSEVALAFFDRQLHDGHENLLYVPDQRVQSHLASNFADRATMVGAGYVFEVELTDDHGARSSFVFRPYNSWFAESRRWPRELQGLRGLIEQGRHRP